MKTLFASIRNGRFPVFFEHKPSETFIQSLSHDGSPAHDCVLCGRVHFNSEGEFMDEGELEKLQAQQKNNPEKYISHQGEVWLGTFAGEKIVLDCPCNGLGFLESVVWGSRRAITDYFEAQALKQTREAKENTELAKRSEKAVKESK